MSLCRGDSGGGLVFMDQPGDAAVPYLRGVASTAPRNEHRCNAHALSALTHVRAHRDFLKRHIPDLEEECKKHFPTVQDRYGKYEKEPEKPASGQPGQLICNCNCFCNNTAPTQDNIISYN
ncbi:uncharacterized protein [Choristoneura fumiferana]|uniref:uncharacterized protein n=1 Tax=Choristoneura fumiferana TaxID=7141 RepID=UPI003D154D52